MVKTLQKLLKLNDENNNNKLFNEIKNYQNIPEKEMEIQNQRFYEIQAFIEANKQKIEQVEKYDELLKENLALKADNEKLRKSSEYLQENKNIKDLIVILFLFKFFFKSFFFIAVFQIKFYNFYK